MTNSPTDLQIIENSRDMEHARQLILKDMKFLHQKCLDKKLDVKVECHFQSDGVVRFTLYSHTKTPFPGNGYGRGSFFMTSYKNLNYDQAFNEACEVIRNADGDLSLECAPWFDIKVYEEIKTTHPREYISDALPKELQWQGPGDAPSSWWATNAAGQRVKVYRSYADYCDQLTVTVEPLI